MSASVSLPTTLEVAPDLRMEMVQDTREEAERLLDYYVRNERFIRQGDPIIAPLSDIATARAAVRRMAANGLSGESAPYKMMYQDRFAGLCSFRDHVNGSAMMGYNREEALSGLGIVTRCAHRLAQIGRDEWGLSNINFEIIRPNWPGQRIAKSLGARVLKPITRHPGVPLELWGTRAW